MYIVLLFIFSKRNKDKPKGNKIVTYRRREGMGMEGKPL